MTTLTEVLVISHHKKGGGTPLDSLWFSASEIEKKGIRLKFVYTKDYRKMFLALWQAKYILFDGASSMVYRGGKIWAFFALFFRAPKAIYWHETDWYFKNWPLNRNLRWPTKSLYLFIRYNTKFLPQSWLLGKKNLVHFHVCDYGIDAMRTKYGYADSRIFPLKNISYEAPILAYPLPQPIQAKKVVGIGKVNPRKRPDLFIQTAQRVLAKHPESEFYYLGNFEGPPNDEPSIRQTLAEAGLEQKVHFVGPQKKPLEWLQDAAVFLHTSEDDPSPKVLMEALGMGKHVAAFEVSGVAEILGNFGGMAPFGDVDALAEKVMEGFMKVSESDQNERRGYYLEQFTTTAFAERFAQGMEGWKQAIYSPNY